MDLTATTVTLPTLLSIVVISVTWAGSIAAVYFGLKSRIDAIDTRQSQFAARLDAGNAKFAAMEERHADHSERLVRLETLLGGMDSKLDSILGEVRGR